MKKQIFIDNGIERSKAFNQDKNFKLQSRYEFLRLSYSRVIVASAASFVSLFGIFLVSGIFQISHGMAVLVLLLLFLSLTFSLCA